jgi:hypothetical protein
MGFVYDIYLMPAAGRGGLDVLFEIPNFVDAAVRGCVDFDYIHGISEVYFGAGAAGVAGLALLHELGVGGAGFAV